MARSTIQEKHHLGERLQWRQPPPQLSHDPHHQLHTVPCTLPPQKHHVLVGSKLFDYRLCRSFADVMLVEQQDEWQQALGFRAVGNESNHRAVLTPLGQAAALFCIQEQLPVRERLDLHNLAVTALPQADHCFVHVHINDSLGGRFLRLYEVRPLPRRDNL